MTFSPQGYVIGEIGTCWAALDPRGRLASLEFHCRSAADAGVDAVKVQLFVPDEDLFCPVEGDDERWKRWKNALVSFDDWERIQMLCEDELSMDFLASAFQPTGVEWLKELEVKAYKVASRAAKTYPYNKVPGPFIISNGMGLPHPDDIPDNSYLLQCVSEYPTPLSAAHWEDFEIWQRSVFKHDVRSETRTIRLAGLSDHSGTPWPAMDALARGAKIVEVHFAHGSFDGPDEAVSLNFEQLKMVCDFRDGLKEMRG